MQKIPQDNGRDKKGKCENQKAEKEAKFEKELGKVQAISQERTSAQKPFQLDKVLAIVIIINKWPEQPIHRNFVRSVIKNHHPYHAIKSIRFLNQAIPKPKFEKSR